MEGAHSDPGVQGRGRGGRKMNKRPELTEGVREYYMRERQALIMQLGNVEDLLGLERSIVPRSKRKVMTDPTGDYIGGTEAGKVGGQP